MSKLILALTLILAPLADAAPRLLLDRADLDYLKHKVDGRYTLLFGHYRMEADHLLTTETVLPPRGGNWSHNYVCPEHGARLRRGKQLGPWHWEHICPVGNHILLGDPSKGTTDFDGNAIAQAHAENAQAILTLGIVYQVTQDPHYATRAKQILLAYANDYRNYPLHNNQGKINGKGGARVASQSLSEATWLISVTQGADLIWDTLSADERTTVADKLLRAALDDVILPHNLGIHNIQCWHNSAIGLVGFLLNDKELIAKAIDDPKSGFRQQIARGIQDDGMWVEGSSGYHFYALSALQPLAEAARHAGIDLYSQRYKSMFDAPLRLAMPDHRLPNFNDSGLVDLANNSDDYELAYARWHDPAYLPLITSSKRQGPLGLFYGVDVLPRNPAPAPPAAKADPMQPSRNSPASGYAILQSGDGTDATWLCVKYGPHGGGHGHPDKNNFILYSKGQIFASDAGTHAYGSPLHASWDKTTIAHNTLTVDETSQSPATGQCLAFAQSAGIPYVVTDAGPIYPNKQIHFTRTLALIDANTILGIDQVTTDDNKPHTLDLAFHFPGEWSNLPDGQPWSTTTKQGYPHLLPATSHQTSTTARAALTVTNHDHPVTLTLLPTAETEIITGAGVGESTRDKIPAVLLRRKAASTT
jgi:hypothetical protein